MHTTEKARRFLKKRYGTARPILLVLDNQVVIELYKVNTLKEKPRIKLFLTFTGSNETLIYHTRLEEVVKGKAYRTKRHAKSRKHRLSD